ncbi:3-oxoacyl-ACP reductase [Halothiobacillus diazotrophicus]|uniref:3-oxoacyl-ACP reductase n=1 Tax=Halothiobacillus diazotrophicus TaxID=1860122 RepID=A0A191ZJL3_9GAMM|nr:3-oxoacyl-ACP reductase FabG [Halothiobacillus diazotrophicus]ANJ68037.1 3-oxoacyl-ACP reductase [Halothiobacillus diazotrophicus]
MKRALVTGGSGAIGSAICEQLAADGLHVFVHANRGLYRAEAVVARIRERGGSAEALCFDVADAEATACTLERLLTDDQPIQVLVNNAGIHDDAPLAGMSPQQWQSVIDVSLNGFYHVTQPLLLPMIRTRWGRIVNVASVAGLMGNRGQVNYSAAKAGLIGATRALAQEVASRGVLVNAVAPGIIESPMIESAFPPDRIAQIVPLKRAGTPQEVADLVSFLASDRAGYITGQVISVNGGMA